MLLQQPGLFCRDLIARKLIFGFEKRLHVSDEDFGQLFCAMRRGEAAGSDKCASRRLNRMPS
jgi:hypothetical protein